MTEAPQKTYAPHQERVIAEKADLDERMKKLQLFILDNPTFHDLGQEERYLLQEQFDLMESLSNILHKRIQRF